VKALLRNPHLRNFLSFVNSARNPKGFMKVAMREPLFVEFADVCMRAIHPGKHFTIHRTRSQSHDF
jgi:hypothetical protein